MSSRSSSTLKITKVSLPAATISLLFQCAVNHSSKNYNLSKALNLTQERAVSSSTSKKTTDEAYLSCSSLSCPNISLFPFMSKALASLSFTLKTCFRVTSTPKFYRKFSFLVLSTTERSSAELSCFTIPRSTGSSECLSTIKADSSVTSDSHHYECVD